MLRLLIGAIVIGFLLYFVKSVLSEYLRPKDPPQPPMKILPSAHAPQAEDDQVQKLQDRIAVLERLIVDAEIADAESDKNSGKNEGAEEAKKTPKD